MLAFIFMVLLFMVFGKILVFAVKAAWGVTKIVCTVVLFPLILIGMVVGGLIKIALPVLLIVGVITLFMPKSAN
ncbi:MAG: hypothetical protein SPF19_15795 [Oliverpabstia sp.]|nr:hypothetical protein [Lachnospiraceae bacterium]MDY5027957.1 hypothetical protein [Oliverpabstia sp.]